MTAWLLDTLLYTGLLLALVLLLRRPVARYFGPQIAYSLWALPFLRLLLPPIVLPASFAPEPEPIATVTLASLPAMEDPLPLNPAVEVIQTTPFASGWNWTDLALDLALPLWLAGAAAFLAWRVSSYLAMRRSLLEEARPVGEVGKIRLVETPAVAAPVAFGVRDKVIAMPQFFMAQPDIASRDLAIAHELAHHRGNDLLANFAAQALLAMHWFNPLAWIGWRAMRRDQEAACDARVISGRCSEDRARYAALIANIAAGPRLALAAPMACPVLGEKSIIHRLRSLSMSETTRRQRLLGRTLIGAGALALPLTASISYAASADVPEPPAPPPAPAAPVAPVPPVPPAPPAPPAAPLPPEPPTISADGKTRVWTWNEKGEDGKVRTRRVEFRSDGDFDEEEFERRMDELEAKRDRAEAERERTQEARERAMERAEAAREREMERAEADRERAMARAEEARERAAEAIERQSDMRELKVDLEREFGKDSDFRRLVLRQVAGAEAAAKSFQVKFDCDSDKPVKTTASSGKGVTAVTVCKNQIMAAAVSGLKQARISIEANPNIPAEARAEALQEIDQSIAEMLEES